MRVICSTALIAVIAIATSSVTRAQTVGDCEIGEAEADLDVNNVDARMYNTGSLFWKGAGNFYHVPKDGPAQPLFATGIWIGGLDDEGELRFAGTAYGPFEYWPGPLDANGNPPADCSDYDRIFSVYQSDLDILDQGGVATDDILDWPYEYGAPVVNGDGIPGNYNLSGGDRPDIEGDQMLWWIMNDVGNEKQWSFREPIGLEVQVAAFSFSDSTALDNTTFYRYKLINKGASALSDAYFGYFVDPDLGNAADDFVASDSIVGMAITYNGTDVDLGTDGYGERPPAIGIDFVSGPVNPNAPPGTLVALDIDKGESLQMSVFLNWNSGAHASGNPTGNSMDPYYYLQGIWRDGTPMTYGGYAYGGEIATKFMWTGNPAKLEYWSEENPHDLGSRNTPADRRFVTSTGPFDLPSGESQEITFAIIWSQAVSRLGSYAKLIEDDIYIQGLYDRGFVEQPVIDPPAVSASTYKNDIIVTWENPPSSNNYLDSYDERSGFIYNKLDPGVDLTYTFEGYDVIQFESPQDSVGRVIATYDVSNDIGGLTEEIYDFENDLYVDVVAARGDNSGVQHHHVISDIILYQDYYFGVQPYAYNANSRPRVHRGPIGRVHTVSTPIDPLIENVNSVAGQRITSSKVSGIGDESLIYATVIDPSQIGDAMYTVEVDSSQSDSTLVFLIKDDSDTAIAEDLRLNESSADLKAFARDIVVDRGLSFSIEQIEPSFGQFLTISNGAGPLVPIEGAAADFQGFPIPIRPGSNQQVGDGVWFIHGVEDDGSVNLSATFVWFLETVVPLDSRLGPSDIEIRFGNELSTGYDTSTGQLLDLPFTAWNIGVDTPADQTDDYQYIVGTVDNDANGFSLRWLDHPVSGSGNDPYSDQFSIFEPLDRSPGTAGYEQWLGSAQGGPLDNHGPALLQNLTLVNWNGGSVEAATDLDDYLTNVVDQLLPEPGTVFRIETTDPLSDGDVFRIDPTAFAPTRRNTDSTDVVLSGVGIVPNPYKGSSAYEVGGPQRRVRFTGLPGPATIRVFTMAGTLVRQIDKTDSLQYTEWDLLTDEGFILGSGIYLVHVTVPGIGERVIKFGHISRAN